MVIQYLIITNNMFWYEYDDFCRSATASSNLLQIIDENTLSVVNAKPHYIRSDMDTDLFRRGTRFRGLVLKADNEKHEFHVTGGSLNFHITGVVCFDFHIGIDEVDLHDYLDWEICFEDCACSIRMYNSDNVTLVINNKYIEDFFSKTTGNLKRCVLLGKVKVTEY